MNRRLAATALILLLTLCCCVRCRVASQQRIIVSSVTRSATGATDVTVASNGDVLFVSAAQHSVYRCASASGTVRLIAGSAQGFSGSTDETGTSARFFFPNGIVCDTISNVAYIADTNNDLIRTLVLSTGAVTTLAGSAGYYGQGYQDGTGTSAMFYLPNGIVLDPKRTTLYVTEYGYDSSQSTTKIRKIVVATAKVTTTAAISATNLNYLCISSSGLVLYVTAIFGTTPYVVQVSISTSTVVKLSSAFTNPQGIALNTNGTALLVADAGSNQTFLLDLSSKAVTTIAGTGSSGFADGLGRRSKFSVPYGSKWYCNAATSHCGVVVADKGNNAIRFVFVPEISISVSLTAQQSSSLSIYTHARHATSSVSSWSASQSIAKGTTSTSSTSRTLSANRTSVKSLSRTRFLSDTMPMRLTSSRTESSSVTRRLTTPVSTHSFSFESSDPRTNCSAPLRLKLITCDMLSSNRSDFNASDYVNGSHAFPCSSNASALNDTGVSWDAGDAGSTMTLAMVASQILSTTFPTTLTLGILRYPSAWTVDVNITTVNSSNESGLDALSFLYLTSFVNAPPSSGTSLTVHFHFSFRVLPKGSRLMLRSPGQPLAHQ